ncbi:hypothetical protein PQX77_019505 [Marasmius sp. AFHP31]|nr:hypothetical protein PQX77_019505 [Marasmius sp. AFHP31]
MSRSSPRYRVAISGGGIGGLALAAFVCQHSKDIAVDIYEMRDIGMEEEVRKRNLPLPKEGESRGPIFRKADQPSEGVDFHNHMLPYGPMSLPRSILLDLVQTKLTDMCKIHTLKHVISYNETPEGPIIIQFKDGSTATADILVGCDGVNSDTRVTMYRKLAKTDPSRGYESFCKPKWRYNSDFITFVNLRLTTDIVYSGQLAYRAAVQKSKVSELYPNHQALDQVKIWCGKNKVGRVFLFVVEPISNLLQHAVTHPFGQLIHVICYYNEEGGYGKAFTGPKVTDVSTAELVEHFQNWELDLINVLKVIIGRALDYGALIVLAVCRQVIEKPSRWAIHVIDQLPHSVTGHVALLGDAAHAMTPHQGVGGGQAIEDAHILGRLLAHDKTTVESLKEVLKIYDAIRLPLAQMAAEGSWIIGLLYDCIHPDHPVTGDTTAEELESLGVALQDALAWLGKGGCDQDWNEAEARLSQLG